MIPCGTPAQRQAVLAWFRSREAGAHFGYADIAAATAMSLDQAMIAALALLRSGDVVYVRDGRGKQPFRLAQPGGLHPGP